MVSFVRDDIIDGDFACCMENLQKSSDRVKDIRDLLNKANDMCMNYLRTDQDQYSEEYCSSIYACLLL